MAYDTSKFLESLESTLVANASTLALSLSVNYPTFTSDNILIGDPKRLTRQIDQYPCIILNPQNKEQPFDEIGMTSSKVGREVTVNVDILCLTQAMSDSEDSDKQARILSRNVETVLETNIEKDASTTTVSDGWNLCLANNIIYDGAYSESERTYQASAKLETEFKSYGIR